MKLHVEHIGEGPELVLLHGWALHGGVFDDLASAFATRFRVTRIDLPGHGQSEFDARLTDAAAFAATIAPHIPQRAIVLGWSLGGLLAMQLATQLALRALVLVSTTPKFVADDDWPQGMATDVFAQFTTRLQSDFSGTVDDFLRLQVRGDSHAAATLSALRSRCLQHPPQPAALQAGLAILRDSDMRPALDSIAVPTLVIAGEHDRITHPRAAESAAQRLPRAQLCVIKRAGHAPFISHRNEFSDALAAFLAEQA